MSHRYLQLDLSKLNTPYSLTAISSQLFISWLTVRPSIFPFNHKLQCLFDSSLSLPITSYWFDYGKCSSHKPFFSPCCVTALVQTVIHLLFNFYQISVPQAASTLPPDIAESKFANWQRWKISPGSLICKRIMSLILSMIPMDNPDCNLFHQAGFWPFLLHFSHLTTKCLIVLWTSQGDSQVLAHTTILPLPEIPSPKLPSQFLLPSAKISDTTRSS